MESLALLVAMLLLGMISSTIISMLIAWRAQSPGMLILGLALGAPGFVVAFSMLNVGSMGAVIFGFLGMLGFIACGLRLYFWWRRD